MHDILTACISIADVTTDISVISNFYHKEQFTFFWIALSVVIFVQLGYATAFVFQCVNYYDHIKNKGHFNRCEMFGWFLVGLSFIFYWTSDSDMCFAKIFEKKFVYILKKQSTMMTHFVTVGLKKKIRKKQKNLKSQNGLKQN